MPRIRDPRHLGRPVSLLPLLAVIGLALASPATAGSLPLAWDPVDDPDLVGYRVYWGLGENTYSDWRDVGLVTSYTLTGLDDCSRYHVAVKAVDAEGLESDLFSNEVVGLPTPAVTGLSPSRGEQGQTLTVEVSGTSFDGGAVLQLSHPGITVNSTSYVSCNRLEASITIGASAAPGTSDADVMNPDRSYGRLVSAFEVVAAVAPVVSATDPADGAVDVPITVRPTVTFSEAMDPASITASTVRLLRPDGSVIPQAAGSPTLDATGTLATIAPAGDLDAEATYQVQVTGGQTGVRDTAGTAMEQDYRQNPGFVTAAAADTTPPSVTATDPADGANGQPTDVSPSVSFSEALDPASVTATTVRLLRPDGTVVPLVAGSPTLDTAGTLVTLDPADDLDERTRYRIQVLGGPGGVKDLAGIAMDSDYLQDPGFRTENRAPGQVGNLRRRDRK